MSYLRFTRDDYRALCRLCSPQRTHGLTLPAFKRLLLSSLSTARPSLAGRIAGLNGRQLGILFDHFSQPASADAAPGEGHAFSGEELRVLAEVCEPCRGPGRFLAYLRASLAERLRDLSPPLARKVARLSDDQFERLYARVTGQVGGD
jgi:hypothetical protein